MGLASVWGGNASLVAGPICLDDPFLLPVNGLEEPSLGKQLETFGVPALGNLHEHFHP